jgi:D-alanine-D-alanine ligase
MKPRVAVIFNRDFEDAETDPENRAREDIRNVAVEVAKVLGDAGHEVLSLGVRDDLFGTMNALRAAKATVVFNLCESLRGDNRFEALLPMLLEFEGLVYTGSAPQALLQALHKDKAKQLLISRGVPTPAAVTLHTPDISDVTRLSLGYPLIVKPTREDASVGIASASVVHDERALEARVRHVLAHYRQPALVERFIDGRELNVSVLERSENGKDGPGGAPEVLPLHEIDFGEMPADRPRIVSFEGKWVESSAEFRGTRPVPCRLSAAVEKRVASCAVAAFRALDLRDYGRVDIRLDGHGDDAQPYVIDVNPNCDLSSDGGGFARAARAAGMSYADLVLRLTALALDRRKDADTIPLAKRSRGADAAHRPEPEQGSQQPAQQLDSTSQQPVSAGGGGVRHRAPRGRARSA